jgi:hypothetical protein
MKLEKSLLKVATVLSAASLIAGFVSYRAGAFDRLIDSERQSQPGNVATPEQSSPDGNNPHLMSGSKSARVVTPELDVPANAKGESSPPQLPAYIGGSKSLAPLIPPGKAATPPTPAPNAPPSQAQQPSR